MLNPTVMLQIKSILILSYLILSYIIVCRMSETNCHIDCEKQTQFMHVKLLVKKTIQLHT